MNWINSDDRLPEEGYFVLIAYEFGVGIAQFIDGDWDTVGANRRHYIFADKQKLYSSAHPPFWMPLPKQPSNLE